MGAALLRPRLETDTAFEGVRGVRPEPDHEAQFMEHSVMRKPCQMRPEVFEVFDFKIDGNTLLLTLRATENGPSPGRGPVRLIRAE